MSEVQRQRFNASILFVIFSLCLLSPLYAYGKQEGSYKRSSFKWGKDNRTYILYIPKNPDKNKPVPLLFALHGGGGQAKNMAGLTRNRFNELADRDGFIVVYPNAVEKHWNDGRDTVKYYSYKNNVDDVGFIAELIKRISKEYRIDEKRIYSTGISNGGFMSYRLGIELSDKIAAIAPVTATISVKLSKKPKPKNAMPVLIINGTQDPLVPYNGGYIGFKKQKKTMGAATPTRDTIKYWVEVNGCKKDPDIYQIPDKDKTDGCTVEREVYSGGKQGSEVILYTILKGGHTWPSGQQYLPVSMIGKTNRDINACDVIWEFFKNHSK